MNSPRTWQGFFWPGETDPDPSNPVLSLAAPILLQKLQADNAGNLPLLRYQLAGALVDLMWNGKQQKYQELINVLIDWDKRPPWSFTYDLVRIAHAQLDASRLDLEQLAQVLRRAVQEQFQREFAH